MADLDELLEYLTPAERAELDGHLVALASADPEPDTRYQKDPIGWMRDRLGIPEHTIRWSSNPGYATHEWDGTPDPIAAICDALAQGEDAGVESATGTGKSYIAAALILWFIACWSGGRAFTFAAKEEQLRLYIWAEITRFWPKFKERFPTAILNDLEIIMVPGNDLWGAWGRSIGVKAGEKVSTKAAGMHAPHMLLVTEETPGVPQSVLEAHENTCTAPHNLRLYIGNPDHQLDTLHQFCVKPGVRHIRISAYDHPNVVTGNPDLVPGAVSRKAIASRESTYGRGNPLFESRVRGISPAEAADALIRMEWIEAAVRRHGDDVLRMGPKALGVDVANSLNGDKAAVATFEGAVCDMVRAFACPNSNQLGRDVRVLARAHEVAPEHVGIDSIGVGAGTVNTLWDAGFVVQALNGSLAAQNGAAKGPNGESFDWVPDATLFKNLRSQMQWQLREDLRLDRIGLPDDPELHQELVTPTYEIAGGKVVVESKEDIKKRMNGRSPNKADAVVYGNWVRSRVALMAVKDEGRHPGFDERGQRRDAKWERMMRENDHAGFRTGWGVRKPGTDGYAA